MHQSQAKAYINRGMYDKIQDMFRSGEIDRLLRLHGVRKKDWADLRQEVAIILLTTPAEKISDLTRYTMGVIRRQYHSRKSAWYNKYRAWDEHCTQLADSHFQIPYEGGEGDMVAGLGEGQGDVQGIEEAGCVRTNDIPSGGGTWHNSRSSKEARSTQKHHHQGVQQDQRKDRV